MPYHWVGKKELEAGSVSLRKLKQIVQEEIKEIEVKGTAIDRLQKLIGEEGLSFIVSTNKQGEPKAYLSFYYPSAETRAKKKALIVSTKRSFTRKKFRSRDENGNKGKNRGGEQKRLFYRLSAIARRDGILKIVAPMLSWKMTDFFEKLKRNPRVWFKGERVLNRRKKVESIEVARAGQMGHSKVQFYKKPK